MIFILEIDGASILAFQADDIEDARAYAESAGEREDLKDLMSNGAPLWNGTDQIGVRPATDAEADMFEEQRKADWEGEPHADAEDFEVFLVPLDEPEDD